MKKMLGTVHGYLAWQETDNDTGEDTFHCVPHDGWDYKQFPSMEELGKYIGQNKLKTY